MRMEQMEMRTQVIAAAGDPNLQRRQGQQTLPLFQQQTLPMHLALQQQRRGMAKAPAMTAMEVLQPTQGQPPQAATVGQPPQAQAVQPPPPLQPREAVAQGQLPQLEAEGPPQHEAADGRQPPEGQQPQAAGDQPPPQGQLEGEASPRDEDQPPEGQTPQEEGQPQLGEPEDDQPGEGNPVQPGAGANDATAPDLELPCHVCNKKPPSTSGEASINGDADVCQCARCICLQLIADEPSEALTCGHVASLG